MRLLSIELSNFRAFFGHHRLEFAAEDDRRVTIFYGENGAGKTNLLNAIHWCVTGSFTPRFQDKHMLINKEAYKEGLRECYVELEFKEDSEAGGKVYRIRRSANNQTTTGFDVYEIKGGNSKLIAKGDSLLRRILPVELASWFFFDAEAIGSLELSGSPAFKADLRKTLGFNLVDALLLDLERVQSRRQKEVANQTNDRDLQAIQKDLENVEFALPHDYEERDRLERDKLRLSSELDQVRSDLAKQPQARPLEQRRKQVEIELQRFEQEKRQTAERIAQAIGSAAAPVILAPLAARLEGQLEDKEVKGRLPSPYSDVLINDILSSKTCICGRPVHEGSSEAHKVRELMEHASTGLLNKRISQIRIFLAGLDTQAEQFPLSIQQLRTRLANLDTDIARYEGERNDLTKALQGISLEVIQKLEQERQKLERERDSVMQKLAVLQHTIQMRESRKKDLQLRYDAAAKRLKVNEVLKRELDKTTRLISHIRKTAAEQEKQALLILSHELNAVLERYLTKHYHAQIDANTYAVRLLDEEKRPVGHSTGEGQVLKFAFIATVVAMAAKKTQQKIQWLSEPTIAPLVLDAPFSALDPVYQGSVARNLATQATQLVLMISSAAWSETVAKALEPQVGKRYLIVSKEAGPRGDKPLKPISIGGVQHILNEYGAERSESVFQEVQ